MVHLKVRVFTFPSSPREQNSYVVGTWEVRASLRPSCDGYCGAFHAEIGFVWEVQGGLLPTVGTLKLDDYSESASVTFAQLRPRIELQNDNFMIR